MFVRHMAVLNHWMKQNLNIVIVMNAVQNERIEKKTQLTWQKKGAQFAGVVAVPAIKVLKKEAPKIAEQVAQKAVNVAAEVIKKKL